jgi:uncharacterized membrane protein
MACLDTRPWRARELTPGPVKVKKSSRFVLKATTGNLASDLAFWQTNDPFWFLATEWMLGAGVVMALLAAVAGFTDFLGEPRIRQLSVAWWHFMGNLLVVLVEAFNWYRRYEIGPDAVVPPGCCCHLQLFSSCR